MSYTDEEFKAELDKRIKNTPITVNRDTAKEAVVAILMGMIKDRIIGPAFHHEIRVEVEVDKTTGVMDVSFHALHPAAGKSTQ